MQQPESATITLAHGNGGELSHRLIKQLITGAFTDPLLAGLGDAALLAPEQGQLAFTTDSFVVKPLFFPGGDIGKLSVCGTVNDLAVCGAEPRYLSCSLIIEEGFALDLLKKIVHSLAATARECGVRVVTGDTKVVERGMADGLFINTAGIGIIHPPGPELSLERVVPGDKIIINGTIGDHGIAVLTAREDFPLSADIPSDCAPLNGLLSGVIRASGPQAIKFLRDPTRGGIGTTLNEFTLQQNFGIRIREQAIPVREEVATIAEMTGFDPLYIANEGKVLMVVAAEAAGSVLAWLRSQPLGKRSAIIGEVTADHSGQVVLDSPVGGSRIVDMLAGEMLPRIC